MLHIADYGRLMDWIVDTFAPTQADKIVHTYVGLAIWLGAGVLLRRPLASRWPLIAVIAAETFNELYDYFFRTLWSWQDTKGDMLATWFWPFLLFAALRWLPWLTARVKD
ncbi:hypothetical protein [Novosphingobium sediminicola]|uniref:VanZ-like domain-containing protein n=1 Tax=Novosphingobium sediminicola TaxID=563162 RepID=A0A7W6CBJ9_9SPHN|nr:hypothetical protein [Novosphingobium sediminicola]MBB3953551.1 hypothetical protein [Novosphingobium sediminicola]